MLGGDFVCFHGHVLYGIRTDGSMRKTDFSRRFFSDNPIAMEESMKYERFFMAYVLELALDRFPSESAFVRAMWGDDPASWAKWSRIKGQKSGGPYQELKLSDVYEISRSLGFTVDSLSWEIQNRWRVERKRHQGLSANA